jgi:hypothetical protein
MNTNGTDSNRQTLSPIIAFQKSFYYSRKSFHCPLLRPNTNTRYQFRRNAYPTSATRLAVLDLCDTQTNEAFRFLANQCAGKPNATVHQDPRDVICLTGGPTASDQHHGGQRLASREGRTRHGLMNNPSPVNTQSTVIAISSVNVIISNRRPHTPALCLTLHTRRRLTACIYSDRGDARKLFKCIHFLSCVRGD